ncbi:MAG: ECF transporter S component [Vagococcus sp.]
MNVIKERLPLLAVLTALTVVLAIVFIIPVPMTKGYVNFLEVGIYTTAMLLGGPAGAVIGAVSGGMLDLILGYPQWMPFSIVIHGVQGYVAGKWAIGATIKKRSVYLVIASIVMMIGYSLATTFLYGKPAGIVSLSENLIQNGFGVPMALLVTTVLEKNSYLKQKIARK